MAAIDIPANEQGKIRVFSLSLDENAARALSDSRKAGSEAEVAAMLGTDRIDPTFVDVIRTDDLDEIGLAGYLTEGNGAVPAQIERDRGKLSALGGWALIVYSSAFRGKARTLHPAKELTLIGTYDEERLERKISPIPSEAAKPYPGSPQMSPVTPPRGKPANTMVIVGLAVLLGLLLFWAFA